MKRLLTLTLAAALIVGAAVGTAAQTPATGRVMRQKLVHSQRVFEAIMTSNFVLLERESAALAKATESPAWSVFNSPEYLRESAAFLQATRDLGAAAKAHDLDAAAANYASLTKSCFQCHRYIKDARLATVR
jgi:hypothetical protein